MRSDFAERCKDARRYIAIPAVPLDAIHHGAAAKHPTHRRTIVAALLAATTLFAAAVGAHVLDGTRFSFAPSGGVSMQFDERPVKLAPTTANLQAAIGQADFQVVMPAGLPPGSALNDLGRIGRSVLILGYSVPSAGRHRHDVLIWLVNRANVGTGENRARDASAYRVDVRRTAPRSHWRAGAEDVIVVARGSLSPAQVKHVKDAMLAAAARTTSR